MEGTTTKEKTIFVNEARRDNYPAIVTGPPTSPGRPVSFSEEYAYSVHFPHKDALVVTIHVGGCKVSKILVNRGNSVNILYGNALDRMENTPEQDRKLINPGHSRSSTILTGTKPAPTVPSSSHFAPALSTSSRNSISSMSNPLQRHPWEIVDPHDESDPIYPSSATEISHTIRNG